MGLAARKRLLTNSQVILNLSFAFTWQHDVMPQERRDMAQANTQIDCVTKIPARTSYDSAIVT